MKALIIYYSFSGNTEKLADGLCAFLKTRGEVVMQRLVPANETKNFFKQCLEARAGSKPELGGEIKFDASGFDTICIGTPVWAFAPAPAINTYLDKIKGIEGKRAIIFTTFGSGTGIQGCINNIKRRLGEKNVGTIKELNVQMKKVRDPDFVKKAISELGI